MACSRPADEVRTLDAALRRLFRRLEVRVVPEGLKALLDRLEEAAAAGAGERG